MGLIKTSFLMLDAQAVSELHDQATYRWHSDSRWPDESSLGSFSAANPLAHTILAHHRANFDLWHEEDKAREPGVPDAHIAQVKHAIDALNQTRNDLVETLDRELLAAAGAQNSFAPLQSESPGLIVDRLSILSLKIFHTGEEAQRSTASDGHRQKNSARLALLQEQRADLAACLDNLWREVLNGKRRFKLYRQLKMYNDPELNPMVYAHHADAPS
jgi:hypothetical protein